MKKLSSAAIGGILIGLFDVLRAIPGLGLYLTCCGCLVTLAGGALASGLYVKRSETPVRGGEGASVGALAGVIGGLIQLFFATPIEYFTGNYTIDFKSSGRQVEVSEETQIIILIVMGVVAAIVITIIATIGGVMGVSIFEKRKDQPVAQPNIYNQPYGGWGPGGPSRQ